MTVSEFALFDWAFTRRGRVWRWSVSDRSGNLLLVGSERSRSAARYVAARAVFQLLLAAPHRSRIGSEETPPAPCRRPECQKGRPSGRARFEGRSTTQGDGPCRHA